MLSPMMRAMIVLAIIYWGWRTLMEHWTSAHSR